MPACAPSSDSQPRAAAGGLLIRELTPADRAALAFAFGRLGARSRHQRFLGIKTTLSAGELNRLTSIDHWHHEALIAWSPPPRSPVGVARYMRCEEFDRAELALAVVDAWQRRGVGRALLAALAARARRAGVRRFTATLLRDNRGALALARELGRCTVVSDCADVATLMVEL